jgi:glycosyltransferase involved in cell wall biosynthesis
VSSAPPRVLMVMGAYYPELSGAGLQCRTLMAACRGRAQFSVLTTTVDAALRLHDQVDDVPVHRVRVHATSRMRRALALPRWASAALGEVRRADIVHLHGFSAKSPTVVGLARRLGRPVLVKLTSVGHDDATSMKRRGGGAWRSFRHADRYVGVSAPFAALHERAGLDTGRFTLVPNGVDLRRFRPVSPGERTALRRDLGLNDRGPVALFVGFFSREKRPNVAFDAWAAALGQTPTASLVFVGRTRSDYFEVDGTLADGIRSNARRLGVADRLMFVERTDDIERFYRAADVVLFPSTREGLPNVVLEAMACGVPVVASRLPGVTDAVIEHGVDGLLVDPQDVGGFADAVRQLADAATRARLGTAARTTVERRFSIDETAAAYLRIYRELAGSERLGGVFGGASGDAPREADQNVSRAAH